MQSDVLKKIDVLVEMAGASLNIDTLKAEKKVIEEETEELKETLISLRESKEEEKYFRASEKQVDENIKVSLEAKIKKQEKSIKKLQKQIDAAVLEENNLHASISRLKEDIRLSKEYIQVLTDRIGTVGDKSTREYYENLLQEENQKLEGLVASLGKSEEDYSGTGGALERLSYLNLAMEEMNSKLDGEKVKLAETKSNLVNPTSYIDEDLKERDATQISEIQKKLNELETRKLEIITDPTMIASEAKEAVITDDKASALAKLQELVTIVRAKPYMDIPSSNDFTAMLSAEEEAAIEARDEFASLIDSKNYLDGDSETIERRIDYLNLEIAALEEKIRISNEEIKNIDSAEFLELTTRLAETEETANQLIKELAEYKIIIETEIEDKTPKRRAILAAAYDRKQKELENVQKIVDNYKEDQKILIHKAYVIETERIKGFQEEIALHKNEITEMNILLADVSKAKDVLAIENDKQKLKELDTVVKNIKHRQKYSQTPSEIFEEIAAYLGGMDTRSFVEEPVMPSVEPLDLELPMNEEIHSFAQSSAESPSILDTEEVVSELPKEMDLEETVNSDPEPLNDNSFVIGDYTDDVPYIDDGVPSDEETN